MKRSFEDAVPTIQANHKGLNSYYRITLDNLDAALSFLNEEGARLSTIPSKDARNQDRKSVV